MSIAITGADGQLGTELCNLLGDKAAPLIWPEFDLTKPEATKQAIRDTNPTALINTAAYTAVDKAEEQQEICRAINATGVETLAEVCRELDIPLVQVSTDYVFCNSNKRSPHTEADPTSPAGVYAQTKFEGERAAETWEKHFVVRTCGLFAPAPESPVKGRNFVDTMLLLARDRDELSIVNDQTCTPTYVPYLAQAIQHLLTTDAYGLYHVTSSGETTWIDFAAEIFRAACISIQLNPISTEEFGAPSPRPAYSVLDTSKYQSLAGPEIPSWEQGIRTYLERIQIPARCS